MRTVFSMAVVAAAMAWTLAGIVRTTEVAGVKFADSVQVDTAKLQINAAGVR